MSGDNLFPFAAASAIAYLFFRPHLAEYDRTTRRVLMLGIMYVLWSILMPSSCRPSPNGIARFFSPHAPPEADREYF